MSIKTIRKRIKHAVLGAMISSGMMVAMSCTAVSSTGGGAEQSFECDLGICTCTGDADCNDMFESGVCGDIAVCDETEDIVTCECLSFSKDEPDDVPVAEEAVREVLAGLPTRLSDATQ